jgi:ribosomal protein S18 acetylase RimI-like enzyme
VITSPRIDSATVADIAGLTALRIQQEWWERSERLLRALLAWDGGRLLVIRAGALDLPLAEGTTPTTPIAVVGAVAAGDTGVIGNVVVRGDYQRRGLARLLMNAALDWQRQRGVRTVWLDATIDGRRLYRSLGFTDCEPSYYAKAAVDALKRDWLRRVAGDLRAELAAPDAPDALARVAALDTAAFGGDRIPLLAGVLREPETWLYLVADAAGKALGYLIARTLEPPLVGIRAGSWVAVNEAAAAALLAELLAGDAPWRAAVGRQGEQEYGAEAPMIHISPPGNNPAALALVKNAGVAVTLDDLIMRLDFLDAAGVIHSAPQRVDHIYAWLAPMVF